MPFILYCIDRPEGLALRARVRVPHLEFVASRPGVFRFGGPLIGDDGRPKGSLMILDLPDRAALDAHMRADPFFNADLFASVTVWQTQQIVPEAAPGELRAEIERQRRLAAEAARAIDVSGSGARLRTT